MSQRIYAAKQCCQSRPRCTSCPVTLDRLERKGVLRRVAKRCYVVSIEPSPKQVAAARGR